QVDNTSIVQLDLAAAEQLDPEAIAAPERWQPELLHRDIPAAIVFRQSAARFAQIDRITRAPELPQPLDPFVAAELLESPQFTPGGERLQVAADAGDDIGRGAVQCTQVGAHRLVAPRGLAQ